jgi:hypothetical protein
MTRLLQPVADEVLNTFNVICDNDRKIFHFVRERRCGWWEEGNTGAKPGPPRPP